ncbi:hypothetical protein [Kitasatospora cathayae]|uniref:DUF2637 domain-containing protein n=1 Tax=Kitasatospora cathayae TaxID=3004092 RepID=A0ABY7QGY2_9ACTN|nr:hypothetical protein [Kitasatospora sp. HUAS 3-15]WBP92058.1 hypothetical protein O1G21_40455 [Kitasatospora sp. HUAS 3-15]
MAVLTVPIGLACTGYAFWAHGHYVGGLFCVPTPAIPVSARVAAWAGPAIGILAALFLSVLLWAAVRDKNTTARPLKLLLMIIALIIDLLLIAPEVSNLHLVLPDFKPHKVTASFCKEGHDYQDPRSP